jgi:hypothetical protein
MLLTTHAPNYAHTLELAMLMLLTTHTPNYAYAPNYAHAPDYAHASLLCILYYALSMHSSYAYSLIPAMHYNYACPLILAMHALCF